MGHSIIITKSYKCISANDNISVTLTKTKTQLLQSLTENSATRTYFNNELMQMPLYYMKGITRLSFYIYMKSWRWNNVEIIPYLFYKKLKNEANGISSIFRNSIENSRNIIKKIFDSIFISSYESLNLNENCTNDVSPPCNYR